MDTMATAATTSRAPLSEHDRHELLRIVRVCLKEWLRSGRLPPGRPHRGSLLEPAAVEVTLRHGDDVRRRRSPDATRPLYKAVAELAIAAATSEPRLASEDVANLRLELVVYVGHERVANPPHGIVVGRHGIAVKCGDVRAVLAPNAAASDWDAPKLLDETCRAAGLAPDAWRDSSTEIYALTADCFGD